MDRHKENIEESFRLLYPSLAHFAYHYVCDRRLAEDVVQTVFLNLLTGGDHFESDLHLKHYLYKAIRNGCINELKQASSRRRFNETHPEALGEHDDLFHNIVRSEIYGHILLAIQSLPAECGKIFRMSHLEHFSNQEIADILNISVNTVKAQKNRAKLRLRQLLGKFYPLWVLFVPYLCIDLVA